MVSDVVSDPNRIAESSEAKSEEQPHAARVKWDDTGMQTSFANVINVLNTREEFSLLFGTNQSLNITELRELTVKLSNRIVLTPFAAKRLVTLLNARLKDYEQHFGVMSLE